MKMMIKLEHVEKHFGDLHVLKDVNLEVKEGEKLTAVIALGYGKTQGSAHRSRKAAAVSRGGPDAPAWFWKGVEAALAAPTAMNQQQFRLTYEGGRVRAEAGIGFFSRLDLGIVKYHFEAGAGKDSSVFL